MIMTYSDFDGLTVREVIENLSKLEPDSKFVWKSELQYGPFDNPPYEDNYLELTDAR